MAIKLSRTPIEVKLVHADDWKSLVKHAWVTSRPNINPDEIDYNQVLKIDTPVSEIPGVVLELYIPMLFREIIANLRDHVMWAQTSRVLSLDKEWNILDSIPESDFEKIQVLADNMTRDIEAGESQDNYRRHLPLSYMSGMTCRFSIRTLFKLLKYFDHLSNGTYHQAIHDPAAVMYQRIHHILEHIGTDVDDVLNTIKFLDIVPKHDTGNWKDGLVGHDDCNSSTLNHTTITVNIPLSLRAQLIRHRNISVSDTLWNLIQCEDVFSTAHSVKMIVEVSANNNVWKSIVSKRNCWLAQSDLWKPIIDRVNQTIKSDGLVLPCSNGVCPYSGDCVERLKKTDPGIPCPRHIVLMDQKDGLEVSDYIGSSPELLKLATDCQDYARDSSRPVEYWTEQVDQMIKHMHE